MCSFPKSSFSFHLRFLNSLISFDNLNWNRFSRNCFLSWQNWYKIFILNTRPFAFYTFYLKPENSHFIIRCDVLTIILCITGYGSLQCHWFIHVPPGHKILLYFDDFEVEGNPAGIVQNSLCLLLCSVALYILHFCGATINRNKYVGWNQHHWFLSQVLIMNKK